MIVVKKQQNHIYFNYFQRKWYSWAILCYNQDMKTQIAKEVATLHRLHSLMVKYTEVYYRKMEKEHELSSRMYNWIDTYNDLRDTEAWKIYCTETRFSLQHDASDLFA